MSLHAVPSMLINTGELAERVGCSPTTINRMRAEGLPSVRVGVRLVRFDPVVAMAWLRDRQG